MNWWHEGWTELRRKGERAIQRVRLMLAQRRLANAEVDLGMMGWQQADFFADEEQEHIERIMQLEREEASQFNRGAELNEMLRELERQHADARRKAEEELQRLSENLEAAAAAARDAKAALEEKRCDALRFDSAIKDLERQISNIERVAARLLATRTSEAQNEASRIPQHRAKLEGELDALRKMASLRQFEVTTAEDVTTRWSAALAKLRTEVREREKAVAAEERAFSASRAGIAAERKRAEKQFAALEQGKQGSLRLLGQRLADYRIAPRNQPEALECVIISRQRVTELIDSVASSLAHSAGTNRQAVRQFYLVMWVIVVAGLSVLAAFLS